MKTLIIGGNGFIGSHLAEKLLNKGEEVSLLDIVFNSNTSHLNCEKIRGDISNIDIVKKAVAGKDVVFHFAAVSRVVWGEDDPVNCWRINVMGTANVLEACRKTGSNPVVIYASSREVYGEPIYSPVTEDHPKKPKSVYGASKLAAEHLCAAYERAFDTKVVILRFSNVYGSERDQLDRVTPKFMLKAMRNEDITLNGGTQVLDFCFIDDLILGLEKLYNKAASGNDDVLGQDFHFATGKGTSVAELAEMIKKTYQSTSNIRTIDSKSFDVEQFIGDPTKCFKMVGFRATTTLAEGLAILKERLISNDVLDKSKL